MMTLSDELLLAYVDGQLDKPQASIVAQLMRDDQAVAYRVSRFQQTQTQLLDVFGALLREGSASTPRNRKAPPAPGAASSAISGKLLTASLLIAIGAGLGVTGSYALGLMNRPAMEVVQLPPVNWPGDIAEFHGFFTNDSLLISPESQTNPEMVQFQLSRHFNGLRMPDFRDQALDFLRGQMLSYRGNRLMQIIYAGKGDAPVALYVATGGLDMAMTQGKFGDVRTVSWTSNELRFILAADMPHQMLQALAVIAKAQIEKR